MSINRGMVNKNVFYIHNGFFQTQRMKLCSLQENMSVEKLILSELRQSQKDICHMVLSWFLDFMEINKIMYVYT